MGRNQPLQRALAPGVVLGELPLAGHHHEVIFRGGDCRANGGVARRAHDSYQFPPAVGIAEQAVDRHSMRRSVRTDSDIATAAR